MGNVAQAFANAPGLIFLSIKTHKRDVGDGPSPRPRPWNGQICYIWRHLPECTEAFKEGWPNLPSPSRTKRGLDLGEGQYAVTQDRNRTLSSSSHKEDGSAMVEFWVFAMLLAFVGLNVIGMLFCEFKARRAMRGRKGDGEASVGSDAEKIIGFEMGAVEGSAECRFETERVERFKDVEV